MRIRFLRDLPISTTCTFRRGQVIGPLETVPPEIAPFIDGERAELVREDEGEMAIVGASSERAVVPRGKKRG